MHFLETPQIGYAYTILSFGGWYLLYDHNIIENLLNRETETIRGQNVLNLTATYIFVSKKFDNY